MITLYDYQKDAVEKVRAAMRSGQRRVILVAPTAFGKTECAAWIIEQSLEKGARAWFIVDRITLIDQTSERFGGYNIDHGVIQADHLLTDGSKQIQIASAQTLAKRKLVDFPDLIVVDEAHCQYKDIVALTERATRTKVIGLTATPFTAGMAKNWDGMVNGATVNQLLALKRLSPLKIKACVTPDWTGAKKTFTGEYDEDDAGQRGIQIVGDVVQTWVQQTEKFFGGPVKTIVFSPSVKHGEELCRQFAEAGFNFQQISYLDKSDKDRRDKIREFRKPDSAIHGLVSCAVLTKGFDVPDVLCGISCRPYRKSLSSHVQELGRVMRVADGKEFGLWLDHSGNAVSFAEDVAWLYEHGVESLSDAQKRDSEVHEVKERDKFRHFCGDCGMQMLPSVMTCAACGWERPKRGEIKTVEGTLIDLDVSIKEAFKPRQGLRAECLKNPRAIWNAALAYTEAHSSKGKEAARKWACGIWHGIYPGSDLPQGLYFTSVNHDAVREDEFGLIEREVRRFRQNNPRRAA